MRAALYHRVSTVDQNPAGARRELRRAAKALGARVVLNIEETGSGANNDRPGLVRVIEAAHRRELDAVIVWKVDRFARSSFDLLSRLRELEACGVRFLATTQGLDVRPGGDATSRLILGVLAAVAEWERDTIRERTRVGLQAARDRGATLGRPRLELPDVDHVLGLRRCGWLREAIAHKLGCSVWAVRQAERAASSAERSSSSTAARSSPASSAEGSRTAAKKGGPDRPRRTAAKGGSKPKRKRAAAR